SLRQFLDRVWSGLLSGFVETCGGLTAPPSRQLASFFGQGCWLHGAIDNVLRWSGFGLGGLRNRRGDLLGRAGRRRLHAARGLCSTRVRWPGNGHRRLWFSRLQRIRFGRLVHGGGWPTRGVEDRPMAWPAG